MSGHHTQNDNKGNKSSGSSSKIYFLLVVLVAAYFVVPHRHVVRDAALNVAQQYFMLPPLDVYMIPIGALLFLVLWKVLARVLFLPYLGLLEEREASGSGAVRLAGDLRAQAQAREQLYEEKMGAVRVSATRYKMAELTRAKDRAAANIKKAQDDAQTYLAGARAETQAEVAKMRAAAMVHVDELAQAVVDKAMTPPAAPQQLLH